MEGLVLLMVESSSLSIRIAVLDSDREFVNALSQALHSCNYISDLQQFSAPEDVLVSIEQGEVQAVAIDPFSTGVKNSIRFIERVRGAHPAIPLCLLGTADQLLTMPDVSTKWAARFGHYIRLVKDQPSSALGPATHDVARRLQFYWAAATAKDEAAALRSRLGRVANGEGPAPFDSSFSADVSNTVGKLETALDLGKSLAQQSAVVPDLETDAVKIIIQDTIRRASTSIERTTYVNIGVLISGIVIVLLGFAMSLFNPDWRPVAFAGMGIAGVITALVQNPLRTIGLESRRLVLSQAAYIGFLNQVRLLASADGNDVEGALKKCTQLNEAVQIIQSSLAE